MFQAWATESKTKRNRKMRKWNWFWIKKKNICVRFWSCWIWDVRGTTLNWKYPIGNESLQLKSKWKSTILSVTGISGAMRISENSLKENIERAETQVKWHKLSCSSILSVVHISGCLWVVLLPHQTIRSRNISYGKTVIFYLPLIYTF